MKIKLKLLSQTLLKNKLELLYETLSLCVFALFIFHFVQIDKEIEQLKIEMIEYKEVHRD